MTRANLRKQTLPAIIFFHACAFLVTSLADAQFGRGAGDWTTSAGDAHRSSWVRTDPKISKSSLEKPGFQLLWKLKLNNEPGPNNGLTAPAILNGYIGYRGFRSLGFIGGGSNQVYGIDTDLARLEWQKHFPSAAPLAGSSCSGATVAAGTIAAGTIAAGTIASVSLPTSVAFPAAPDGRGGGGGGRGGPAKSGVGEPGEGAVTLAAMAAAAATTANAPGRGGAAGGPGRGGAGPGGFTRQPIVTYVLASDGMLHTMYVSNGIEPDAPVRFLPPNANAQGLVVVGTVAYAATAGGCGGVADGVWALDLTSKEVTHWESTSGAVAGSAGAAIGPDGTLYVSTARGKLVAIDGKSMKEKDSYSAAGQEFTSSPVIFQYNEQTLLAASTKDGSIHLLDATLALLNKTSGSTSREFSPGALSSWQTSDGARFILAPSAKNVVAWKLGKDQHGALSLTPGWTSSDLVSPLPPMVLNGVVFAVSSGPSPAVLYAFDASTGKDLWNSGKAISALARTGAIAGGGGQLYLATDDGTLYAFGFPMEH